MQMSSQDEDDDEENIKLQDILNQPTQVIPEENANMEGSPQKSEHQ